MTPMNATKNIVMKPLPQFSSARCKRCGICSHFCAVQAIATRDGMPYLTDPDVCTSCGVCQDMCPDWAIDLEPTPVEAKERPEKDGEAAEDGQMLTDDVDAHDVAEPADDEPTSEASPSGEIEVTAAKPAGNGSGAAS